MLTAYRAAVTLLDTGVTIWGATVEPQRDGSWLLWFPDRSGFAHVRASDVRVSRY